MLPLRPTGGAKRQLAHGRRFRWAKAPHAAGEEERWRVPGLVQGDGVQRAGTQAGAGPPIGAHRAAEYDDDIRRPRLVSILVSFACVVFAATPPGVEGAESKSSTVAVVAGFGTRTSLKVSSQILEFAVSDPGQPAVAVIEFSAGVRTQNGADVVLTVERLPSTECPEGTAVTFAGEGLGTIGGTLDSRAPTIAARWTVSGLRTGRLTFVLHAAPGTYTVPVRFVLSAP